MRLGIGTFSYLFLILIFLIAFSNFAYADITDLKITTFDVDVYNPMEGDTITISYQINNPTSTTQSVWLAASLCDKENNCILYVSGDIQVSVPPGSAVFERPLYIDPNVAQPITYDLAVGLWDGRPGTLGSSAITGALWKYDIITVSEPGSPPASNVSNSKTGTSYQFGSNEITAVGGDGEDVVTGLNIPDWIRNNAKWWAENSITDDDYISGIQFLIQNEIIRIENIPEPLPTIPATPGMEENTDYEIPDWIKNIAGWWADGLISDDDFVYGTKYLIEHGIIQVS